MTNPEMHSHDHFFQKPIGTSVHLLLLTLYPIPVRLHLTHVFCMSVATFLQHGVDFSNLELSSFELRGQTHVLLKIEHCLVVGDNDVAYQSSLVGQAVHFWVQTKVDVL